MSLSGFAAETQSIDDAIASPAIHADPAAFDALFTRLRSEDPVHWTEPADFRPFWTVSKHADIQEVERNSAFLNAPRLILRTRALEEQTRAATGGSSVLLRSLVNMDPPDHFAYRRLAQTWFTPQRIRLLEADCRALARECVDRMLEHGGACDFVSDVAVWYPLRVIMRTLGLTRADEPLMLKLTQEIFGNDDPDVRAKRANADLAASVLEFQSFFRELSAARLANPTDDLATVIATAEIDGRPIADHEAMSYYILVATAGHDTTSSTVAGGLLALIDNPQQQARLVADPALMPAAVEEMTRWVSPVRHFFRTARDDYELRGRRIAAGDNLMMCYPSANRDEEAFDAPFAFRIDRTPNRHLAFGYGPHLCLGQHLARMEVRVFFEELLARVEGFERAGAPSWLQSSFVSGLKALPIRFRPR
ncbi:MAG: cytochrome P450 [Micropepsaceae bacterium]